MQWMTRESGKKEKKQDKQLKSINFEGLRYRAKKKNRTGEETKGGQTKI